jgi:tRNA U34 5-carboxymethylaminomethyl modifying enzyme MnmG/GidA
MEIEKGFYAAGEATGSFGLRRAYLQGKIAGLSAAISLNYGSEDLKKDRDYTETKLAHISES